MDKIATRRLFKDGFDSSRELLKNRFDTLKATGEVSPGNRWRRTEVNGTIDGMIGANRWSGRKGSSGGPNPNIYPSIEEDFKHYSALKKKFPGDREVWRGGLSRTGRNIKDEQTRAISALSNHGKTLEDIKNQAARKLNFSTPKTASVDYDEMVKTAYEDIIDSFEKEASTAFDRWVLRNPGVAEKLVGNDQSAANQLRGLAAKTSEIKQKAGRAHSWMIADPKVPMAPQTMLVQEIYDLKRNHVPVAKQILAGKKGKTLADIKASAAAKLGKTAYEEIVSGIEKEAGIGAMMTKLPKFSSKIGDAINNAAKTNTFGSLHSGALNYGKAMDSITHSGSHMPSSKIIRYKAGQAKQQLHTAGKNLSRMYSEADKMGIMHGAHPNSAKLSQAYDTAKANAGAWGDLKTSTGLGAKLFPNSANVSRARNNIGSVFGNSDSIGNIRYY